MIQEIIKKFFSIEEFIGHQEIFGKVKGWIGVTIGKIFLLVYFMFRGILDHFGRNG